MKVLIVGLGSIAKKHIAALKELGDFQISALRSNKNSNDYEGIINIYDAENLGIYDFFIISNPTYSHFDTLKKVGKFKKPIFIEKPIFNKVGFQEDNLIKRIITSGVPTYVGCNLRFLDSLKKIKSIISDLIINEINIYAGSYLPNWRTDVDFRRTYSANASMGGGVHIDLIHELDYLYWMVGAPFNTKKTLKCNSSLGIDSIDYANYLWDYKNFCASIVLNYYRKDSKRTLEIIADSGTYKVDLISNKVFKNGQEYFSSSQTILDTYKDQMKYFVDNIRTGANFENDIQTAYNVLKLCLKD